MIINMSQTRVRDSAKRLERLLREMGFGIAQMECLELSARLLGFNSWQSYWTQHDAPLCPLDQDLTDEEFLARDAFQMEVLEAEGFGDVARILLDRVDPTGSWRLTFPEESEFHLLRREIPDPRRGNSAKGRGPRIKRTSGRSGGR